MNPRVPAPPREILLGCLAAALLLAGCGSSYRDHIQKGQKALEEGQYRAAAAAFEKAGRRATLDPVLYYNLAFAHLALGEKTPAMAAVEKGLEIEPANTRLHQLKAVVAYGNGDWPAAREALGAVAAGGAPETYVLNARAAIERMEKNYDQARLLLHAAMRLDAAYPPAYYNLASLYLDHYVKLLPQAYDLFEMFTRQSPLPEAKVQVAADYLARISKILEREAPPAQPRNTSLSAQRMAEAARFAAARNWASARGAHIDAVNADPLSLDARLALAAFYVSRGDSAAAGTVYIEAAAKIPNATTDLLYKAAEAAIAQRRPDVAAEFASRGLARAPGNYRFHYQMAVVRAQQNRPGDARAYAEYCARLAPEPFAGQVAAWAASL